MSNRKNILNINLLLPVEFIALTYKMNIYQQAGHDKVKIINFLNVSTCRYHKMCNKFNIVERFVFIRNKFCDFKYQFGFFKNEYIFFIKAGDLNFSIKVNDMLGVIRDLIDLRF